MKASPGISSKAGLPPGTLVHVGEKSSTKSKITVIDFQNEHFSEEVYDHIPDLHACLSSASTTWINIDGIVDTHVMEEIGKIFDLNPLLLEDVLNTYHRPKVEEFDNCLFTNFKMIGVDDQNKKLVYEQVSLVLGENWILSFQEKEGDIFEPFRNRIRENKGLVRKKKVDYLFYRLIDIVVDHYFYVNEFLNEHIDNLDEELLSNFDQQLQYKIQNLKKQVLFFRRSCVPLRDVIYTIQKEKSELIKESSFRYLNDVYDHLIQLSDSIETQRELLINAMDMYNTGINNRMNKVMQVLTIIATIFIPLTFVAGIYGMNFENMPELKWQYGYASVWGLMLTIFIGMMIYFRHKKWF